MCTDPKELFISKSEYAKWIKEFLKTKRPLVNYDCKRHKPFVCRFCFGEWFYKPDSYALLHQPEEQEIREIQPGQWRDKGEKIYGPVTDIVYWPKNRHWESIKNIPKSTAPSIHDPITRCQKSYLNGGGGSGKTTHAIRIFKNINMVVFTHTNALAKDFREKRDVKAQTWHMGEWTPERMGEKKFPRVVIWDEVICCGDDAQPPPFFREMPHNWLKEHADYYEEVLTDYCAKCPKLHELKKAMQLHQIKYPEIPISLIYRPRDGRKQNCLVQIPGLSEKKELVKNDIVYLFLNTLPDKFLKDMLADKKVIDWELGYAMTIHTIGRVEYLNQLIRVEAPLLPPEIAQEIEEAKKKRQLKHKLRLSIQEKLIRYIGQNKEKGHKFDLTVDYILTLKCIQEDKCASCLIEMKFEWDQPGDILQ
ncbi:24703_t:CDS:2 [Cetraspora pellucida]|uniref:24703_t:CDS:1 n=1 Tax=Cetraspora pellucida TaxID=1433469 RepID=A0A9N8WIZ0_9GLOM|nr:24703_t:CDS:2 [Cetraspora pellucida]